MTPAGLAGLKAELTLDEGDKTHAYLDGGGVPTIGIGHTGPEVRLGMVWTQAQVDAQFAADVAHAEAGLIKALPWFAKLDDPRQECLTDMAFNLGVHGLLAFHRTLTFVQDGDNEAAAHELLNTHPWVDQIGARAARLAAQMRTGVRQPPYNPITAPAPKIAPRNTVEFDV
ncbi:MAG: glycoside hydrolase family protein [Caulobacteraceae bacterium]